jgi:hypothetical protein
MKHLHLFSLLLFLSLGCVKSTEYSGRILSAADNSPVEGANCFMTINGKFKNNETEGDSDEMNSDSLGNYELKVKFRRAEAQFIRIEKTGFVTQKLGIEYGKCREQDIVIYPYDAYLSVTFENKSSSVTKNFYYNFTCSEFGIGRECGPAGCGPHPVVALSQQTQVLRVPGGLDIDIIWDTKKVGSIAVPNKVTTFCPHNDTTYITIPF